MREEYVNSPTSVSLVLCGAIIIKLILLIITATTELKTGSRPKDHLVLSFALTLRQGSASYAAVKFT